MLIRVANVYTYRVQIAEDPRHEGLEANGTINEQLRVILLRADLDRDQRRLTLRHEVHHAFEFAFPGMRDDEHQCDFSSTVSEDLDRQIEAMGGWKVLDNLYARFAMDRERADNPPEGPTTKELRYTPIAQRESAETSASPRGGRAQCGKCEYIMSDGSIITSGSWRHAGAAGWVVRRQMYCPHCNHLMEWIEGATLGGAPNGSPIRDPDYITDQAAIDLFLQRCPQAVGLAATD